MISEQKTAPQKASSCPRNRQTSCLKNECKVFYSSSNTQRLNKKRVVMTPQGKKYCTVVLLERKLIDQIEDRVHVAGGKHTGIIVNRNFTQNVKSRQCPPQISLQFRVFLVSSNTGDHSQELRTLRFWFRQWVTNQDEQTQIAQDFFKELVNPKKFPKDYVGFIKKGTELFQRGYNEIEALEIEMRILEDSSGSSEVQHGDGYTIYSFIDSNRVQGNKMPVQLQITDPEGLTKKLWLDMYNVGKLWA